MTISEAFNRVKRLDARTESRIIIELTGDEIILLNQAQLYTQSIDRDGDPLGGYFSQAYEDLKKGLNPQLGGLVDLNLTGDFYGGFYVSVGDTEFVIGSTDEKSQQLENKYGKWIFGLTEESRATYIKTIFIKALMSYLQTVTKFPIK